MSRRNIIGFVPIRSGSKSIPNKNIKEFCGKPLVYWMAKAMSDCDAVDAVYIAVDCEQYENVVLSMHLPKVKVFRRSDEVSTDEASSESVLLEFISKTHINLDDIICFGQATSPLTTSDDITKGLAMYLKSDGNDSVLSACRSKRFFWDIKCNTPVNYDYMNRPRRQEFEGCYEENGAFYINSAGNIASNSCRIGKFPLVCEMPAYNRFEIDDPIDWDILTSLAKSNKLCGTDEKKEEIKTKEIEKNAPIDSTIPKLFICDVDGTLTDGGMYYGAIQGPAGGFIAKKFNTKDGFAVHKLHEVGTKVAWITSETNPNDNETVRVRANKLGVDYLVFANGRSKVDCANEICTKLGITFNDCGFVGDSENDIDLMQVVGDAFCPADAHYRMQKVENITVLKTNGGEGVLREITDIIYGL